VIDAEWNVVHANRGAQWLVSLLLSSVQPISAATSAVPPLNMLDMLTVPGGLVSRIVNLREVAPPMLAQLGVETRAHPALAPKVAQLRQVIHDVLGGAPAKLGVSPAAPILITRFASPLGVLSFFTMLTTFGTPHDITLASLRIEHLFAADATTAELLETHVPMQTRG
jgi:MmyB-like transcription regulator ligand binding domain